MFLFVACAPDAGLKTYNSPPSATILTPTAGEAFWEYEPVTFSAKVSDNATATSDLILVWSAGATGALAGEQTIADELVTLHVAGGFAAGDWGVSLQVTDEDGESVVAEVQFAVIENLAPNVSILLPAEGSVYGQDTTVPVSAFVTDADAASNEELALTWNVEGGPAWPNTSGYAEFTLTDLAVGSHEISVTVTDAAGDTDSAVAHFSVSDSDVDGDGYSSDDCDDSDSAVHPGADETCDTVDNDCDGAVDEEGGTSWYADTDADGYGGASAIAACSQPSGYAAVSGDCDDASPTVNPGATETCNETDDDCDGSTDEDAGTEWFLDADGDGYGAGAAVVACDAPAGHVALDGDCDDADAEFHPSAAELCDDPTDYNCDGSTGYADADGDGLPACEDCDDSRALSDEECNGVDDDCDGDVDESSAVDAATWYVDRDADGYGAASTWTLACDLPSGYADNPDDCDDSDDTINPGAAETCDLEDEDCDGVVDNDAIDVETWYLDDDGDGYGTTSTVESCEEPAGYAWLDGDCDDADAAYNPGATEACDDPADYNCDGSTGYADADGDGLAACEDCDDGRALTDESCNDLDDDCDGDVDEGVGDAWYADVDGDGHGAGAATTACDQPTGYEDSDDDCDDGDSGVSPDAVETCDDVDEDCDGDVDEGAIDTTDWYADGDGDGYGDGAAKAGCDQPSGYVAGDGDCDDGDAELNPGETEVCDDSDTDEDCDGKADDLDASVETSGMVTAYIDNDGDDYGSTDYTKTVCDIPSSYESSAGDCDDTDASVNVASTWYIDADGDGYGGSATTTACDEPSGYTDVGDDCDDGDATVNPGAGEDDGDAVDEDCDGCAPAAEEDFESGTAGTLIEGTDGWECFGTSCVSVYSASPVHGGSLALSLAGGSGEVGQALASGSGDFVLSLYFYDAGGATDTWATYFGSRDSGTIVSSGVIEFCDDAYCASSDADGDVELGARSTGWHALTVQVDDAGTMAFDVDGTGSTMSYSGEIDSFWFNDDGAAESIDDIVISDSSDGCTTPGALTWYADGDGDGYGDAAVSVSAATWPSGYVANADDCDDAHDGVGVEVAWYADTDGDGYGNGATKEACDQPSGYAATDDDCDDGDAAANPGESEVCDEIDNDCDGDTDEGVTSSFYADGDSDGYGAGTAAAACSVPSGYVSSDDDCDDGDSAVHPGADEYCNDADDDCDEETDEEALDEATWYVDADGDGYGVSTTTVACDLPSGYADNDEDCDDADASVNPGASEAGGDEDCDGCIPDFSDDFEGETDGAAVSGDDGWTCFGSSCSSVYSGGTLSLAGGSGEVGQTVSAMADDFVFVMDFYDSGDTSGNFTTLFGTSGGSSEFSVGYSSSCGYCIDGSTTIASRTTGWHTMSVRVSYSSHTAEVAIDATTATVDFSETLGAFWFNDDGSAESVDDIQVFGADSGECSAGVAYTWYYDGDGDGYGDSATTSASWPSGYVIEDGDCDDSDSSVSPGAEELCGDGVDQDCDGVSGSGALEFDGIDDYVDIPEFSGLGDFTYELWVDGSRGAAYKALLGTECGDLYWNSSGFEVHTYTSCNGSSPSYALWPISYSAWTSTWMHIALVRTSSNSVELFIDGVQLGHYELPADSPSNTVYGGIGGVVGSAGPDYFLDGRIAGVRVSAGNRYAADFAPAATFEVDADTVALWDMSDGSGSVLTDVSGNGYDGTIYGATWVVDDCP